VQGVLDPLNDARKRAADIAAACPNVAVVLLEAGHCPHDEQPGAVNDALLEFLGRPDVTARQAVAA
jgi:pimeloyl-ACP methyl ester carboxylesterase